MDKLDNLVAHYRNKLSRPLVSAAPAKTSLRHWYD